MTMMMTLRRRRWRWCDDYDAEDANDDGHFDDDDYDNIERKKKYYS